MNTTPLRIDTHQHIVPPVYAAWLAERGLSAGGRAIPDWSGGTRLAEGVKVIYCNGYDLARRHTPFCRVELRHRRELSQSNKTSSFRAAAPRGAATLHRTMMSIFSHNGTA